MVRVWKEVSDLHAVHGEVVEAGCDVLGHSAAVEVFVEEHILRPNERRDDLQRNNAMSVLLVCMCAK